jgi:type I restriction enzyme R subunit
MSGLNPTEKKFEDHIERYFESCGYSSTYFSHYDRNLCLIRDQVIDFIKQSQPENWGRLEEIYNLDVESKVLSRISSEISKRGILDVLRNPVVDRGVYINLCYFQPKSDLNPDHLRLYKLNKFTVVRQVHYSNLNENSIDMVLFLNGLPIVTMELKNQLTGQNVIHSQNQYKNDRDPKEPLLNFKRCLVHFCVDNDRVSMTTKLSGQSTYFLPYNKDIENPRVDSGYRSKYLWEDILTPDSLLDILENFAHVSEEKSYFFNDKTQKIDTKKSELLVFPRYHQLDLIRKLRSSLKQDGTGKNYLIQHTTGSGKSYSIGWLSHALSSLYKNDNDQKRLFDTIIVVTDRTVLDDQLRNTIRSLEKTDGVVNGVEKGSKELREFLEQGKDIIVTTIQKFPFISETIASLGNKTFAVIIDEVHSSQSGELSKELKKSLSKSDENDDDEFDYEDMLRQEIESRGKHGNISFFGFTGTPKEKTLELFGTKTPDGQFVPFHTYSMYQSIYEKFTLDVLQNYTTYKRYFKVKQKDNGEIEIPISKAKKEMVKYVDSHQQTIEYKVNIMLDHWIQHGSKEIQGRSRGMVVTQSRRHCVQYFFEINKQLKERGINYEALVGFSGEVNYEGGKYTEYGLNQSIGHDGNVPMGLKNPKYRLLIVANKFQTGFDEPLVQSMYVDKHLGGVQCVQTLSRLNRTCSGKTSTFVLDFVNEVDDVKESFQRFYKSTILEGETDPNSLYDIKRVIEDYHLYTPEDLNRFCKVFFDPSRDEGELHPILDDVVFRFKKIEEKEQQEEYKSKIQQYIRMYGYLSQIVNFSDIELEKSFVFLKYLNKKLPKRDAEKIDIFDSIDLDSLRIQKTFEKIDELINEDTTVEPPTFGGKEVKEPEKDFLSEIIGQINQTYGVNLTEEDRIDLDRLKQRLIDSPEVDIYMKGDNSEDNKKTFFKKQFDDMMVDYVNGRFEFYKKMEDNQEVKNMVFQTMYSNYKKANPISLGQ